MYRTNLAAADQTFKGKPVRLTGVAVKKDPIAGGETRLTIAEAGSGVQCIFGQEQKDALERIVPGQMRYITILGRCEGKQGNNVVLRDCSLVTK